ncbi:MAG: hypothetical protein HKN31_16115 [Pricia sp.]|nr:hypothetical protein [Pricia sp.]
MRRNLFTKLLLFTILIASFAIVPIACSSDDGGKGPVVLDPTPDPTNSNTTITATSPVVADGTTTSTVSVKLADTNGDLLTSSGGTVALAATGSASVSSVTDNSDGTYSATVTNTTAETVTISGTLGGTAITDTAEITFTEVATADPDPTNANTTIDASAPAIVEGTSTATVTVQIADTNGDLLTASGGTVELAVSGSAVVSAVTDNGDGTYTATVTDETEEAVIVTGTLDGVDITDTAEITFNPDDSNPAQEVDQSTVEVGPSMLRINSGGPEVTFGAVTFLEDQYFGDNSETFTNPSVTEIANTDMDAIYLTERVSADGPNFRGPFSYNIPVSNGTYTVKLYFAEIYWGVENPQMLEGGEGSRIFNIIMEDTEIFTGYDLFKEVGAGTATSRMYDIEVTDGELNITFQATINKPKVSAIEVFGNGTIGS